jgi:CubicO group peptidase (beta-lactamase class C family)
MYILSGWKLSLPYIVIILTSLLLACKPQAQISDNFRDKYQLTGFSMAAVYNGEMVFSYHGGMASITDRIPVTAKTMFRVASVSKIITSMAFMILEQEGLAGLDDDVSELMGYKVENPHYPGMPVTPRMLMTHTSGLNDGANYMSFLLNETYENPAAPSIRQLINSDGARYTTSQWNPTLPGNSFNYSNLGYGLLGTIVEKISGERFDIFVKTRILNPLQIEGGFNIRDIDISHLATLYRKVDQNFEPQFDYYPDGKIADLDFSDYIPGTNALLFSPQGGLRISAEDLSRIMILLMNHGTYQNQQILLPATVDKMLELQWIYDGANASNPSGLYNAWGLGLFISTMQENKDIIIPGYRMIGHYGQAYGLLSGMYFCRESGFGIVFMLNGKAGPFNPGNRSALFLEEEALIDYLFEHGIKPHLRAD